MSIRLFILGELASEDNYPYMIKKKLLGSLPHENFIELTEGKFYYNFDALQKKGYIQAIKVIHEKNRPDKTLYSITEAGRQALEQEIYDSFKKITNVKDLFIAIHLLKYVDTTKAAIFYEETIQQEKKCWQEYKEYKYKKQNELPEIDRSAVFISDYAFSEAEFNIEWMEKLLAFIKSS
ncbi:MAG: PadR family transcriptional regulator [Bacillus sp. (in: firmicutes)]